MTLWLNTTINSSDLSELHLIKHLSIFSKLFRVFSMGGRAAPRV